MDGEVILEVTNEERQKTTRQESGRKVSSEKER